MREDKGFFARLFTRGTPECAVLCALLGVLTALLLLWAGVWVTLLVALCVAVGAFIVCKELLYLAYFYLTGVDIVFIHVFRVVFAGVLGAAASLALLPLWRFFLLRRAEDTLLARRIRRHREKKEGGQTSPETPDSRGKKFARAFRAGLREGFMAEPETAEAPDAPAPALEDEAREEAREDAAPSDAPEKGGTDA